MHFLKNLINFRLEGLRKRFIIHAHVVGDESKDILHVAEVELVSGLSDLLGARDEVVPGLSDSRTKSLHSAHPLLVVSNVFGFNVITPLFDSSLVELSK